MMCVMSLCSANGGDEDEHVDTPRYVQHKSSSQSGAHEMRYSAAAVHTTSSSRPTSGRSRVDVSNVGVGPSSSPTAPPKSSLSYVETPHDTVTAGRLHSIQDETVGDKERSVVVASSKLFSESADASGHSRVTARHDDTSRVSVTGHNSNAQSSVRTHESTRSATTSQSSNHDRPKTPRLALYNTFPHCLSYCCSS